MSTSTPHEPRLSRNLRTLLNTQRVAALGTLGEDGLPFVSMVPYALEPGSACVVIHVSGLAAHTRNLQRTPQVSLLVMQAEVAGEPVHALPRVTLIGKATVLERDSAAWLDGRNAYLARFPEAEPMTRLGDFMFVAIHLTGARQVAGFGAARSLDAETIQSVLRPLAYRRAGQHGGQTLSMKATIMRAMCRPSWPSARLLILAL